MSDLDSIRAEVTFMVSEEKVDALRQKATQLDEEQGDGAEETYTLPQALQVVWHLDPEWLHEHVLSGWTLDRANDPEDPDDPDLVRSIWPEKGEGA